MSNYLDRLVLRARGELPVPRPQLAPIFPPSMAAVETEDEITEAPLLSAASEHSSTRLADSPATSKSGQSPRPRPLGDEISTSDPGHGAQAPEEQILPLAATEPNARDE
ncbi:MAG: hypothetical protein ACM3JD_02395, partial [Rudaea sp.]